MRKQKLKVPQVRKLEIIGQCLAASKVRLAWNEWLPHTRRLTNIVWHYSDYSSSDCMDNPFFPNGSKPDCPVETIWAHPSHTIALHAFWLTCSSWTCLSCSCPCPSPYSNHVELQLSQNIRWNREKHASQNLKKRKRKARTKLAVKQIDIVTTESSVFRILRTALVMLIVLGASRSLEACQGIDLEEEMASRTKKIRGNCQEHIASSTQFLAFSTPGFAKFRKGLHWCHYEQVSNFNVVRSWWVSVDHCRSPRTLLGIVGPPQAKCQEVVPLQRSISWLAKKMNLD